ncbi:MAG: PfkB family carbohydrate kinase [Chloroflexota bacterium]
MTSILLVGSIGLDTLETPFGRADDVLGGSASYFALAASLYAPVRMVAVVGDDFPAEHVALLESHGVDLTGLQRVPGKTFRWAGRYRYDMNSRDTLDTQLNVFADFHPEIPEAHRESEIVFLANIHPQLQLQVLDQVRQPRLVALDSMNLWIDIARDALDQVIARVDVVTMNDEEARQYADTYNLIAAAQSILARGPKTVIIKKGEHGCLVAGQQGVFAVPGYPLDDVQDPTGAGDAFAGGVIGYLAAANDYSWRTLKRALVHGCVVGSFTVQSFGVDRLASLERTEIEQRYQLFRELTAIEPSDGV